MANWPQMSLSEHTTTRKDASGGPLRCYASHRRLQWHSSAPAMRCTSGCAARINGSS
jgi:hypothetical protein